MTRWCASGLLLAATVIASNTLVASPAAAQDAAELKAIQAQIAELQAQLKRLQREAAARDAALKKAQDDAAAARAEASQAAARPYPPSPPAASLAAIKPNEEPVVLVHPPLPDGQPDLNAPTGKFRVGGSTITLGGYIEGDGLYRSKNLTSGTGTPFSKIPFGISPNAHVDEFRGTAQQTRLSLLLESKMFGADKLTGYVESDFNGAATSSNSVGTNSYTPRLRQAFVQYDLNDWGLHVLAGQAWSLATAVTGVNGLNARSESIPMTIDTNYLPGFVYTRNPQLRLVQDFGAKRNYHIGFSIEAPQSTFAVSPTTASGSALPPVYGTKVGDTVFYNNSGGNSLNSTTTYSEDAGPDLILKGTADPGYGHYEVYGLGRFFRSQAGLAAGGRVSTTNDVVFGGGVGGAFTLPLYSTVDPRTGKDFARLELTGDVLGGYGVGRYGAAGLADGTFQGNGEVAPLPEVMGYVGLLGHPTRTLDLYSYFGADALGRSNYRGVVGGKAVQVGYGGTTVATTGCYVEGAAASTCAAVPHALYNVTLGAWWKFLKGPWGTVQTGVEYSYTRLDAFRGAATATSSSKPHTTENIVFVALRYSPFN